MKFLLRLFTIVAAMFFAGCYDHPLTSTPSKEINTWLLGVWEYTDKDGEVSQAIVTPMSHDKYAIQISYYPHNKKRRHSKARQIDQYEAWASRVGDTTFLTLHCIKGSGNLFSMSPGNYLPIQIQLLDQNNLRVHGLALESPSSASSYDLRKEVRQKLKTRTLYSEKQTDWKRVAEVFWSTDGRNPVFTPLRNPTF